MTDLENSAKRLREAAQEINAESDALTKTLKSLETKLNTLNLGIQAQVKAKKNSWGYGRLPTRKWGDRSLPAKRWGFYKMNGDSRIPLSNWSRDDRASFSHVLSRLIAELVKKSDEKKDRLGQANMRLAGEMERIEELL